MRRYALLIAIIILYCSSQPNRVGYIPNGIFLTDQKRNEYIVKWYIECLTELQEPSLYSLSNNTYAHSYRFLWVRSFDNPIALRLSLKNDGSAILNVKESSYARRQLIQNKTINIAKVQVDEFLNLLKGASFWRLPTMDGRSGFDGATWILEGINAGKYQIVVKWSPNESSFRDAALFLLKLSELEVDKDRIY